jgi:pyridoxal phosphate enzyme (YggS family)
MTTSSTSVAMTTSPASSASADLVQRVARNLAAVRERISRTGRDPASVRIVAVTKTFGLDAVRAAVVNGLTHLGENYVDELCQKRAQSDETTITWHYLGAVQSNKVARVVDCADVVASVSRIKELERIAALAPRKPVYLQVDYSGAPQRHGAREGDVALLVERARALEVDLRGLMTVAPMDPEGARRAFRSLGALADQFGLAERSMGMSDDLELACACGTSEVRIGRALFGARAVGGAS